MKKQTTGPMLMPKYVSRFSCTGGACEDTCCSGRRVDLDKTTLHKYEASPDPELRPLFAKYVKRHSPPKTARLSGFIEMMEAPCRDCPFLNEAKLCQIQSRLGEAALSDGCATFPRSPAHFGDLNQMALSLSCPEVVRLALLEEDACELEACESSVRSASVSLIASKSALPMEAMDEIRTQMFQILLTREMDLSRRMAVVGLFCQRLDELIQQDKGANLPGLIGTMDVLVENGAQQVPLKPLMERQYAQVKFAERFLLAMQNSALTPRQRRVVDASVFGLNVNADVRFDRAALLRSLDVGTVRLEMALQNTPWLLEHYLINEAFREVFPWAEETPYKHFINFLMRFTILRVMLVGRAASQETPLTPQQLAETVQVFCRWMQFGKEIIEQFDHSVANEEWTRLSALLTLV